MRLKEKIRLSKQGHDLLEKKKFILTVEKDKIKNELNELRMELNELIENATLKLKYASIDVGLDELINISEDIQVEENINIKYKTIMGVEIPSIVYEKNEVKLNYGLFGTTSSVDECILIFNKIKEKMIRLAELENTEIRLEESIKSVQKRSNALQDIIIPNDEKLEHEITNILEERDREEFTRLKVLKRR